MARTASFPALCIAAAVLAAAGSATAEGVNADPAVVTPPPEQVTTTTPATSASVSPIVVAPGPARPATVTPPPAPRRARAISPEVAAQLAAAAPKFTPAPPKPLVIEEDEGPDLRDIDKPKNGIIRLPKYIVREPAPPVFSERAINTKKGLADLAMKRYLPESYRALNAFTLPLFGTSPEQHAMAMYAEDERLRNMASLADDARMISAEDKAGGAYVRRQIDSAFLRPGNFDWHPTRR